MVDLQDKENLTVKDIIEDSLLVFEEVLPETQAIQDIMAEHGEEAGLGVIYMIVAFCAHEKYMQYKEQVARIPSDTEALKPFPHLRFRSLVN